MLNLCMLVLSMKLREEEVLCFSLANYVATTEIPPFPTVRLGLKGIK